MKRLGDRQALRFISWPAALGPAICACFANSSGGPNVGVTFDAGVDVAAFDGSVPDTGEGSPDSSVSTDGGGGLEAGPSLEAGPVSLGFVWHEIEEAGNCHGTWTRQGMTSTFSSVWADCGGTTATITISIVGTSVTVHRTMDSGGNDCTYMGTLSADALSVTGNYTCMLYMPPPPGAWSATIDYGLGDAGGDAPSD